MSHQNAIAFIQQVNNDHVLRTKVESLNGNLNALLALAAETGYNFSALDWNTAASTFSSSELSESDLDSVAGGILFQKPQLNFQWTVNFSLPSGPTAGIVAPDM